MKSIAHLISTLALLSASVAGCGSNVEPSSGREEATGQTSQAQCGSGPVPGNGPNAGCSACYRNSASSLGGYYTCTKGCDGDGISETYECVPPACGGVGQLCCPDTYTSNACVSNAVCAGSTCEACGGQGQPCCTASAPCGSNSALSCQNNACETCGQPGGACCANDGCSQTDGAYFCESGTCVEWVYTPPPGGGFTYPGD